MSTDEIAELVWDGAPPNGAPDAIRALIMRPRRRLGTRAAARIVTRSPGYAIEISGAELGWRVEADLHHGRHEQLVPQLQELTACHPVREQFHGQLMLALHRCGRQAEALAVHWAHQHCDRFPDGQLYVNLRGFDPTGAPLPSADAVRRFLTTLGVPRELHGDPAVLDWFDAEHPNALAALQTASAYRWHLTVWRLAWVLSVFHTWRGLRHDDLVVWQAAADAADHLPDPTTRTLAYRWLGRAYADLGRHHEAIEHLNQALAESEHHHDCTEQAHTHRQLARAWERRGDDQLALHHATRALNLFRDLGQPVWEARALSMVGWSAARLGEYELARAYCQATLTTFQRHDDPYGEAAVLNSLGYIEHHTGQHQQAIDYYQQALDLLCGLGNTYESADILDRIGHPHAAVGQHELPGPTPARISPGRHVVTRLSPKYHAPVRASTCGQIPRSQAAEGADHAKQASHRGGRARPRRRTRRARRSAGGGHPIRIRARQGHRRDSGGTLPTELR
ncbi:MAG: BTAD domain-containing putative transcriptional regulator [Trebonia sp.]